jgi:hypothetical protein
LHNNAGSLDGPSLSTEALAYFFTFAQRFFCAAEILARAAADIVRLPTAFGAALPVKAEIAASTPAIFRTRAARSWWSMVNRLVI